MSSPLLIPTNFYLPLSVSAHELASYFTDRTGIIKLQFLNPLSYLGLLLSFPPASWKSRPYSYFTCSGSQPKDLMPVVVPTLFSSLSISSLWVLLTSVKYAQLVTMCSGSICVWPPSFHSLFWVKHLVCVVLLDCRCS